jgi:hypothetical protein
MLGETWPHSNGWNLRKWQSANRRRNVVVNQSVTQIKLTFDETIKVQPHINSPILDQRKRFHQRCYYSFRRIFMKFMIIFLDSQLIYFSVFQIWHLFDI